MNKRSHDIACAGSGPHRETMANPARRAALRWLGATFCAAALPPLAGCASRNVPPAPAFDAIALLPVVSPPSLYTENRIVPLPVVPAVIMNSAFNRSKSAQFNARMKRPLAELGPRLTAMLLDELKAQGFSAHMLEGVRRKADDPDTLDYARLPTGDREAVLHVWFSDVSMDSPRTSSHYLARLNVEGVFLPRRDAHDVHQQYFYYLYGADSDGDTERWSIPSPNKYRYPSFDALMARADEVEESWQQALQEIARRLAGDLPKPATETGDESPKS